MKAEVGRRYRHYKGNEYVILAIAKSSEDIGQELVVYQDLSDASKIWARPRPMFEEDIEIEGKVIPRFTEFS